ncbi:MAG: FG-GAP-like repeat-containing protein [Armatimonadetes bacterium]|nr:FG-GAP-like repeat-containing protein [Armatimonadota bacterium]
MNRLVCGLFRVLSLVALIFAATVSSGTAVTFTDANANMPAFQDAGVAWGDYDGDGDLDLAIVGDAAAALSTNPAPVSRIYRNTGGTFSDSNASMVGIYRGCARWGDFDNDNDLDILISGQTTGYPTFKCATKLYRNDNGVFVEVNTGFPESGGPGVDWADLDNDGDLDVVIGANIFRNDCGSFAMVPVPGATDGSSASFGDYDNDSDLDLMLTGSSGFGLYANNGGAWTYVSTSLLRMSGGSSAWGDYDNDGDLDLAMCGYPNSGGPTCKIYRNDNGVLTDAGTQITGMTGSLSWGDYDNDGDLDLLVAGVTNSAFPGVYPCSKIYQNIGGTFVDVGTSVVSNSFNGAAWGDFDNDGDLDLAVAGYGRFQILRSSGAPANTGPTAPGSLSASVSGRSVTLTWAPPSDQETPVLGLSYNLRVGTIPSGCDIFSGMADIASGFRRLPAIGNAQKRLSWTLNGLRGGTYYWSVQAIDAALAGSPWAAEQSVAVDYRRISGHVKNTSGAGVPDVVISTDGNTASSTTDTQGYYELWVPAGWTGSVAPTKPAYQFVPSSIPYTSVSSNTDVQDYTGSGGFSKLDVGLPRLSGAVAWGDYDGDGDMDLAISGDGPDNRPCKVFRNDSGRFTDIGASLPALAALLVWGDYDNDGDMDLALCGWNGYSGYFTAIYRNDNGTFTDIKASLVPAYGSVAWGDYDNDGDLDLIVTGANNSSMYHSSNLYRNDDGVFNDAGALLIPVGGGSSAWGDYDNDGDLDLLINGAVPNTAVSKLYRNDRGMFVDSGALFAGSTGNVAWGDFDNDGDLDLAIIGYTGSSTDYLMKIYRNDAGIFVDIQAGLPGLYGKLAWGDYDNDGDIDLAISGATSTNWDAVLITRIYRNDLGTFVDAGLGLPAASRPVAFADYDNDGDLDLMVCRISPADYFSAEPVCLVYRNDAASANSAPAAPGNLAFAISEDGVTFSWDATSDDTTPAAGLSYNIRVGTLTGAADAFSGMSNATSGLRQLPALGNAQKRLSWTVRLPAGTYYWSVQAVDAGYAGSTWGVEQQVTVDKLSISGRIVDSTGAGLSGVRIGATNGGGSYLTDSSGYYELWVPVGWSGTVTPDRPGYEMAPLERPYTDVSGDLPAQDYAASRTFTSIGAVLSGVAGCSLAWGDYDGDGDLDLALAGSATTNNTLAKVYRNNAGQFVDSGTVLPALTYPQVAWVDYDNDGDIDLTLAGQEKSGQHACYIYRNTGSSLADSGIRLPEVRAFAWGDFDNDGRLDLAVTRAWYTDRWRYSTGLYRNSPDGLTSMGVDLGQVDAKFAWGDYDNDGDQDLILGGHIQSDFNTPNDYVTTLYRNDSGVLTKVDAGMVGLSGSLAWGDYDNDGDLDLLISGSNGESYKSQCTTRVYRNDSGQFVDINASLVYVGWGCCAKWADYDNDGDVDIALTGSLDSHYGTASIYRNDDGNFVLIDAGLPELRGSSLDWGDFDNDGRVDLVVSGSITSGYDTTFIAAIYHNNYHVLNTAPLSPDGLMATADSGAINFTWNAASDSQTPSSGLSYNLRVGTTSGGNDVFSGLASSDTGLRLVPSLGNAQERLSWRLNNLPAGTYCWSVQTIDGAYAGSPWASEQTLVVDARKVSGRVQVARGPDLPMVKLDADPGGWCYTSADGSYEFWVPIGWSGSIAPSKPGYTFIPAGRSYDPIADDATGQDYVGAGGFVSAGAALPAIQDCSLAWGDYDKDGDLDLALCGSLGGTNAVTKIFRNDARILVDSGIVLPGYQNAALAWGDFDNDGDLDLAIVGGYVTRASKIYINNNGTFTEASTGLVGVSIGFMACGDYDNDGDLDLAIGGQLSSGGNVPRIYRNDRISFVDINAGLTTISGGSLSWADYDRDGDLDLLAAGAGGSNISVTTLYRNDGGKFVDSGARLAGVYDCAAAWGDYDNDGDLDLALAGWNQGRGRVALVYRNDSGSFVETNAGLVGVQYASLAWGDCDGDGDLDLVAAGQGATSRPFIIYRNDSGTFTDIGATLPGFTSGSIALGDYDGDGDLDLAAGGIGLGGNFCALFRNDGDGFDTPPVAPDPLPALIGGSARFRWTAASDIETPSTGLSYNLRVGTTPGGQEVSCAMADTVTGTRLVPTSGNSGPNLTWGIKGLPDGIYYWSIQAIDPSFAGSPWSAEQTLVVETRRISGYIRDSAGGAVSGVTLEVDDGSDYALTGANGYYELRVHRGWTGTVSAVKSGLVFSPPSRDCSNVTDDLPNQDFLATPLFTNVGAQFPLLTESTAAWGDYDNDGDLDLALGGYTGTQAICRIYRNDAGIFTDIGAGLPGRRHCSFAWGDHDNDGDLDLVCGGSVNSVYSTRIYRNDGGSFAEVIAGLPSASGSYAWGDYDNDGDLDILICSSFGLYIYANDKGQFKLAKCGLPSSPMPSSTIWVDYDDDGDLDIAFSGTVSSVRGVRLFRNDNGQHVDQGITAPIIGSLVAGDYDNDGDSDLMICGIRYTGTSGTYVARILRNDAGSFVEVDPQLAVSTLAYPQLVDYDNDGDLDLQVTRYSTTTSTTLYRNDGGAFCDSGISLPGSATPRSWGDFDSDGNMDALAITGSGSAISVTICRNNTSRKNSVPVPPSDLTSFSTSQGTVFCWKPASDAETPKAGLTYNLRVGSRPGACDLFTGMANQATGRRLLPGTGNACQTMSWTFKRLPPCRYYWSVQAIDSGLAGSPWAAEQSLADISFVKSLIDGSVVQASGVVTAVFADVFYIEKPDRTCGIRVETAAADVQPGNVVAVQGRLEVNADSEAVIQVGTVLVRESASVPRPWLMNLDGVGGGPLGLQEGVSDWRPVKDSETQTWIRRLGPRGGANNIGLLVKVTGVIRSSGDHYFYLDGTCTFDDGSEAVKGIRVYWPFDAPIPSWSGVVEMTAISSCTVKDGVVVRMLRPVSSDAVRSLVGG